MTMHSGAAVSPRASALSRTLVVLFLCVAAVAVLAISALAQEATEVEAFEAHGFVYGEKGEPLVGAFVSLTGSDWGSITNRAGRFRLPDMDPGTTSLTVEQLGYETLEWRGHLDRTTGAVELRMTARPVLLEGLTVVTDRFRGRRNATATSVRAFEREDLVTGAFEDVVQFVQARVGLSPAYCPPTAFSSICYRSRGRAFSPVVYVDEMPVIGGMDYLASVRPHELYMVEVYARGRHIRAYTHQFMERAARGRLQPVTIIN